MWGGQTYDPATGRMITPDREEDTSACPGWLGPPRALWRREKGVWQLEVPRSPKPAVLALTDRLLDRRCVVSADGGRLASFDGPTLVLWDLGTLQPIAKRPEAWFGIITFTPHGLAAPVANQTDVVGACTSALGKHEEPDGLSLAARKVGA